LSAHWPCPKLQTICLRRYSAGEQPKKPGAHRADAATEDRIRRLLAEGHGVRAIQAKTGCGSSLAYRIKAAMEAEDGE
jgi:hypothetical protein